LKEIGVIEDGLLAGPGCIVVSGVDLVISLDCSCPALAEGAERVCYDIYNGRVEPWKNLVGAIKRLLEERARGRRVYVHCIAGCGRTGTVVSAYLMLSRGMSADEAMRFFYARRRCGPETWEQITFLKALDALIEEQGREAALRVLEEAGSFEEFLGMVGRLVGSDA